ncbi:MAG: EamA family transporter [Kangiellaceae bacterium]|jgi:drug/metabolite transporter (DMT)-like permease|nr:EamA family transporter [Kangiellaceae bacterium]
MKPLYLFEFVILAMLWGASFLFMKVAAPEFGAVPLIELRVAIASVVLIPIVFMRGSQRQLCTHLTPLLIVGATNSAIPFSLFAFATLSLSAGYTSVVNSTAPLWAAMIGFVWLKQRYSRTALLGFGVGFAGVMILVWSKLTGLQGDIVVAVLAAVFAAVLYGYAVNYSRLTLAKADPFAVAGGSMFTAALMLLPWALWQWPATDISQQAWSSVIALGLLCTALAYVLYFRLIKHIGSEKAITVTYFIPLFGSLFGYILLDEMITSDMLFGGILIILGTGLVMGLISFNRKAKNQSTH